MYIRVISTLDQSLPIQFDIIISGAFHSFKGAEHSLPEVQLQEKQQLVTPNSVHFTETVQRRPLFPRCEVASLFWSNLLFQAIPGFPLPAPLQLGSRCLKRGLLPRLLLSNFLSFPLLPSTSLPLFPSRVTSSPPYSSNALGRREGAQAPILKATLRRLRASGRVFPPPEGL